MPSGALPSPLHANLARFAPEAGASTTKTCELLFLQLHPGSDLAIDDTARARLAPSTVATIEQFYRGHKVTGTLALVHSENIELPVPVPWQAVIVLTRPLEPDETPTLKLPGEATVGYFQGQPHEPVERGWMMTSPEANQYRHPEFDDRHTITLSQGSASDNETRFLVAEDGRTIVEGTACRWR